MHGNVWQWCENLFDPKDSARVYRGSCWSGDAGLCRAAFRDGFTPVSRFNSLGFRLARVPVR
jgi:formylglycine-generating enzyme required for sulfatase activity